MLSVESVTRPTESLFDHDRYFAFTVHDEAYTGSIHVPTQYYGKPDFVDLDPVEFGDPIARAARQ